MTFPGLVRANNLSDVTDREKAWDNLGSNITTGNIAIPAPSFSVNFAANQSFVDEISGNNLFTFSRASTGTFVGSNGLIQTAASGVPRFDHNPVTGESLALLLEEARTNFVLGSNTGGPTDPGTGVTVSTSGVGPDGVTSATQVTVSGGPVPSQSLRWTGAGDGVPWSGSATNVRSFYVKVISGSGVIIKGQGGGGDEFTWNLSTLSYSSSSAHPTGAVINVGNGWYRCWIGPNGTGGGTYAFMCPIDNGTYLFWGFQAETGSYPSSYIPTDAATVTRAADVATISGANLSSFYNAGAGTIYTEQPRQGSSAGVVIGDSASNRLLDWQSSRIYRTSWGGTDYTWTGAPAVSAISLNRAALSYGASARGAVNGTAYTLSPFAANETFTTTSLTFQGVFSRIAFWKNPLTPSAVAAVTAISNTAVSYLADSYSTNFTITGGDVLALEGVRNTSTRDFVRIQGLTSTAQPRLTAANTSTLAVVDLSNNGLLKLSPTSSGNYSFASGLTLSGVSLRINGTNARSIATSPFSGSTATVPLLLSNLRPQANWRITEPMTSGTIASPSLAIPFEADDFVLFMKAGQS